MRKTRIVALAWCVFAVLLFIRSDSLLPLMVLAATAAVLAVCMCVAFYGGKKLEIQIVAPPYVGYGDEIELRLVLKNQSWIPVCRCVIHADCENLLTGEVCPVRIVSGIWAKRESAISITLETKFCGCVECKIDDLRITDPFFLFEKRRRVSAEASVYVQPRIADIVWDEEEWNSYNMESYRYSDTRKGNDPSETFGIRVYEPGDSPKTIHWKLTGKLGELVVRELGLPVENSTAILLDKRMDPGEILSPGLRSRAAELAVSLSASLLNHETPHTLGWQDYKNGCFVLKRIVSEQDLWEAVSLLLSGGFCEDKITTPMYYLESGQNETFANYVYVTAGNSADVERLEQCGAVKVYRVQEDF